MSHKNKSCRKTYERPALAKIANIKDVTAEMMCSCMGGNGGGGMGGGGMGGRR